MITFNARKFHADLDVIRRHKRLTWAEASREIGVPTKTITAMENNAKPNADNLAALIDWSNLDFMAYVIEAEEHAPQKMLSFERLDEMEDTNG